MALYPTERTPMYMDNYAYANDPNGYETLNSYYSFKAPMGSALAFMVPTGSDAQYMNLNRTTNLKSPAIRSGYSTLTGDTDTGGDNYFSLSRAYTGR